jgi:5-methyltetrahydropteroyltriglutamate--homocysteine methyltransferase
MESTSTAEQRSATATPRSPARSDHVGSLLRPPELLAEIHRVYERGHTTLHAEERAKDLSRLRELEDQAIQTVVQRQIEAEVDLITDGEFRRVLFTNSFYDAVEGLEPNPEPLHFYGDDGSVVEHPGPALVSGRLRKLDSPGAREAQFLASITDRPLKITFPAPSWFCFQSLRAPALHNGTYDGVDELLGDTVGILGELASDAAAAGASCLQFDEPAYSFLVMPGINEIVTAMGSSADRLMESAVVTDRRFLEALPGEVTTAVHLCRGNYASRHMSSGTLDPVAEAMFSLPFDRFLIEWEDVAREGDFSALRHVPSPGPIVVLGVLSSKSPRIETEDELLRRIEDATAYLPIEQLAISPQCGFASALSALDGGDGNEMDADTQWRKLEVQARVAERVWGSR